LISFGKVRNTDGEGRGDVSSGLVSSYFAKQERSPHGQVYPAHPSCFLAHRLRDELVSALPEARRAERLPGAQLSPAAKARLRWLD